MGVDQDWPKQPKSDLDVVRLIAEFDRQTSHLSFGESTRGALRFMAERLRRPATSDPRRAGRY